MSWRFQRVIPRGERFPRGYGLAWRCFERDADVAYPVPLNALIGWLRAVYRWLRWDAIPERWDAALNAAYERGRRDERARRGGDTFKCAQCGGTFDKEWSDEEAMAEAVQVFGPEGVKEPLAMVCDGCYLMICPGGKPIRPS